VACDGCEAGVLCGGVMRGGVLCGGEECEGLWGGVYGAARCADVVVCACAHEGCP